MPPPLRPLTRRDGQLPIEDHALVGDGETAALVGRDGGITWLCPPRFDSDPLVCGILDAERGGRIDMAPEGLTEARQSYVEDTGIAVTELRAPEGLVRVTDALALRAGSDLTETASHARGELVRRAEVLAGRVRLRVRVAPRGGATAEAAGAGLRVRAAGRPDLDLRLTGRPAPTALDEVHELGEGDSAEIVLSWAPGGRSRQDRGAEEILRQTADAWRAWAGRIDHGGRHRERVRRSAITLQMLDHTPNGAIVAAPTTSLPEAIGGPRNWDYRFTWIRDAAYSVYALGRIGLRREAHSFLAWVLDAVERDGGPRVLYDLDGRAPGTERVSPDLRGYRGSAPVRFGNAAAHQRQHDVYGELLDCAYQWADHHGSIDAHLWSTLAPQIEAAGREWRRPDHGIWEVRSPGRVFTYSAAMCQVALDRGARLADRLGLPGDPRRWERRAAEIARAIVEEAWNPGLGALAEHLDGGGGLDASLLSLPLRRVVPADHPRMAATAAAIAERLGAGGGLLRRYLPEESPDGLPGEEGAFLLCSFWLVDNLTGQGRREEAEELFDSLCARGGHLGLLPEQIDPSSGAFLGNHPQAISHVGLISSAVNLVEAGAGA